MLTNNAQLSLPIAVWLADAGGYDLKYDPYVVSATTLLKSTKSVLLSGQIAAAQITGSNDVSSMLASKVGTAVHNEVEDVWKSVPVEALKALGYNDSMIDRIVINKDPATVTDNDIPMYFEQRRSAPVPGHPKYTISGKFDYVIEGVVHDLKTTKVYTYINGSNDANYIMQGSIYRWLNPDIITADHMVIDYIFKDWQSFKVTPKDTKYPVTEGLPKKFKLKSNFDTITFISERVGLIDKYRDVPQDQMPNCTPEELWQNPPKYAYFRKPTNKTATKLFDDPQDAYALLAEHGGGGRVDTRLNQPTFCLWCAGRPICKTAADFTAQGLLPALPIQTTTTT